MNGEEHLNQLKDYDSESKNSESTIKSGALGLLKAANRAEIMMKLNPSPQVSDECNG